MGGGGPGTYCFYMLYEYVIYRDGSCVGVVGGTGGGGLGGEQHQENLELIVNFFRNQPGGDEPGGDEPGSVEPGGGEPGGGEPGGEMEMSLDVSTDNEVSIKLDANLSRIRMFLCTAT